MLKLNKQNIKKTEAVAEISNRDIAVIGMSVKMPLADGIDSFWKNIVKQVDCVRDIPYTRLPDSNAYANILFGNAKDKIFSKAAYLRHVDFFDYKFFNLSPKEASLMSPPQRLFLQSAYQAIEDSGYSPTMLRGSCTGVYLGFEADDPYDYKRYIAEIEPESMNIAGVGNLTSVIAGRVSYLLDFKGPCISIDTACSSSLVSIHLACQGIRNRECDMALVGSVRVNLLPIADQLNFGANSSDGKARTFDDASDGTGSGEGVAAILLKPLGTAVHDRDNIYAIIKGSACNQDGSSVGLTAPNVIAQRDVLIAAWKNAGISPETISYIEAHGTGTKLGDPIEIDAIRKAFNHFTDRKQFCAISSIKTNIGHLDNAAGLAGFIKATLSLYNKKIPGILHFNRPNQNISFEDSPVYIVDNTKAWKTQRTPRRCGVSSFGFSGTNCHVILEEAPKAINKQEPEQGFYIFVLSAMNINSLNSLIDAYIDFLSERNDMNVDEICYTVTTGRQHHTVRLAIVVWNVDDITDKLIQYRKGGETKEIFTSATSHSIKKDSKDTAKPTKLPLVYKDESLFTLCLDYVKGTNIDWASFYLKGRFQRVHLPQYQFTSSRCWLSPTPNMVDFCTPIYEMQWEAEEYKGKREPYTSGAIVLFRMSNPICIELGNLLRSKNSNTIEVVFDNQHSSSAFNNNLYYMSEEPELTDWNSLDEWLRLIDISQIIHATAILNDGNPEDISQLHKRIKGGVLNALCATKVVLKHQNNENMQIAFLTNYADRVDGSEKCIHAENAAVNGLAYCLRWEHPAVRCFSIDIDDVTTASDIVEYLSYTNSNVSVAYRNNQRYLKIMKNSEMQVLSDEEVCFNKNGVYIVAGGMGGIGMHIVKALRYENVNIALVGRTEQYCISDCDMEILINPNRKKIQKEAKKGQVISYHTTDISNYKETKTVISNLRQAYGAIHGVINCAGVSEGDTIINDTIERYERVFSPKIYGTWNLEKLTQNDELEFFLCLSSAITLMGGIGSGAYTAANCYMDSFANATSLKGKRSIAINWPAWKDTGMAQNVEYSKEKELFRILSPHDGVYALFRVLASDLSRVIVGDINKQSSILFLKDLLPFRFDENIKLADNENKKMGGNRKNHSKTIQVSKQTPSSNDSITQDIVFAWKRVLGYENIDVNENFFSLGGDSILMTKVHELLKERHKVSMADLFTYPTIFMLSNHLAKCNNTVESHSKNNIRDHIIDIIQQVENQELSVKEALEIFNVLENIL